MRNQYVAFVLDEQRYALHLPAVDRVVHAVRVTPLINAPEIVLGVVNARGQIVPVIQVRRRLHLPEREVAPKDQLIFAHTARRAVALVVDRVAGIVECGEHDVIETQRILPGADYVEGVIKLKDDLILLHDLDAFLSLDEVASLDNALEANRGA